MSQSIDNQIVKMQFDNVSFEKNARESMSTLDKLKKALKFDKVNMDPLQQSLDNINMDKVTAACDKVTSKFSLLGTIGDQIIRDLTTKFTNAAEKMVKSFTIDQVASGWDKYAQKTTAVQTIMANTIGDVGLGKKWADQAEQMEAITAEIEKLNWFTDETSYSLTDMTDNIGKFVAQKVPLEQATKAMMGISAWAAVSGQTKTQAGMAMYNLSQALGAGSVKAIDWKSIENANMATAEFKQTVIDTAKALGVLDEATGAINKAYITASKYSGPTEVTIENFRDTLTSGWFNDEVLMNTLEAYGGFSDKMNQLYEVVNREGMTSTTSNLLKVLEDVKNGTAGAEEEVRKLAKASKMEYEDLSTLFKELSGDEYDLGRRAFSAAQEAKTFQEAIDATSDAVASEWMGIFETIFGNYLEAKELWTDLANSLWNIFAGPLDNIKWALKEWKDSEIRIRDGVGKWTKMTGRELLFDSVAIAIRNVAEAIEVVRSALADVFPIFNLFVTEGEDAFDTTEGANGILRFTLALHDFAKGLKLSEESASALHTIIVVLATSIKVAFTIIGTAIHGVSMLIRPIFNVLDALFGLIGKIVAAITGNNTITEFSDKLAIGGDKIRSHYYRVMEKIADVINKIADAIRGLPDATLFRYLHDAVIDASTAVKDFWDAFVDMPVVQEFISDFNKTLDSLKSKVKAAGDAVNKALSGVKTRFKVTFTLENLNKVLQKVYDTGKKLISFVKDFIARIKEFFTGLKSGKSLVESFRDSFGDIIDRIKTLKETVSEFFKDLFSNGSQISENFNLEKIQQAVHEFVSNLTADKVTMIAVSVAIGLIALNMLRLSEALKNAVDAFTGVGVALKNLVNSYVKKQKSTILQIAEAIVVVAAAIWVLSTIPEAEMNRATGALVYIAGALAGLLILMTIASAVLNKGDKPKELYKVASGLVIMASSLLIGVLALKALEYVNLKGVLPKLIVLGIVLGALAGLALLMKKLDNFNKGSLTILALSGALLVTATSLAEISKIPRANIDKSMDALFKIMIGLAAITFAASKVGVFSAVGLIAIVLVIDKLLPSLERIVNYDYAGIEAGLKKNEEILKKLGLVIGAMVLIGAIAGNRIKGLGIAMLSVAATMGIMLGIAKLASMMSPTELEKGSAFLWSMAGLISLLQITSRKARLGFSEGKGGKEYIRIALTMGIMLGIAKLASMMSLKDLAKGIGAVAILEVLALAMIKSGAKSEKTQGTMKAIAGMLFAISTILAMVALLSLIPMKDVGGALAATLAIILAIAVLSSQLAKLTSKLGKDESVDWSSMVSVVAMAAIIGGLGLALIKLSDKDPRNVLSAGGSIVMMLGGFALILNALGKFNADNFGMQEIGATIAGIFIAYILGYIVAEVAGLMAKNKISPGTILSTAAAITITLAGVSLVLATMNKFTAANYNYGAMGRAIGGAIGALVVSAVAIFALSKYGGNATQMIAAATAIAIALIGVCFPIAVLGAVGKLCSGATVSKSVIFGALGTVVAVAAALTAITRFGDTTNIIQTATALAIALFAVCIPIAVIGVVGKFCKNVGSGIGAVVTAVAAMAGVAGVLIWLANSIDANSCTVLAQVMPSLIEAVLAVSMLAMVIAGAGDLAALSGGSALILGPIVIVEAIAALGAIAAALSAFGSFVANEGGVFDADNINRGLDMLIVIGDKLGTAIGTFVGNIGVSLTAKMGEMADNLSDFADRLTPFAEKIKVIDQKVVDACSHLAAAMLMLTAAEFLDGIQNFMELIGFAPADLDFSSLGVALGSFCESIKDIPDNAIDKAGAAAEIAKSLVAINDTFELKGGLAGLIFGEKEDLGEFGRNIKKFGEGLFSFCESVANLPVNAVELAQRAADAATPMVDFGKTLTADGGLIQDIIGHKDIGEFGLRMCEFIDGLSTFMVSVDSIEKNYPEYPTMIKKVAEGITPLVEVANSIKNIGGLIAEVVGDGTLDAFGKGLPDFGKYLRTFVNRIGKMANEHGDFKQLIIDVADATAPLVVVANNLENMNSAFDWLTGKDTLDAFGKTLEGFGGSLVVYTESLEDADIVKIQEANSCVTELVQLGALAAGVRSDSFSGLKLALETISEMPVSSIANEITVGTPDLITAVDNMFKGMTTNATEHTIPDQETYYEPYGLGITTAICLGITKGLNDLNAKLAEMVSSITGYLDKVLSKDSFEKYGGYIVAGIQKGIDDNADAAVASAEAMALAINEKFATIEEINSPSRVFERFGMYDDLGLAKGIDKFAHVPIAAVAGLASDVVDTASTIISDIARVIDSNVDVQPTIRPVLDTSDIENKASKINNMFSGNDLAMVYRASGNIQAMTMGKVIESTEQRTAAKKAKTGVTNNIYIDGIKYNDADMVDSEIHNFVSKVVRKGRMYGNG